MIIPIRCFTCGKTVGNKYEKFLRLSAENIDPKEILDQLGLRRYCCRRMILSHVERINVILNFQENVKDAFGNWATLLERTKEVNQLVAR